MKSALLLPLAFVLTLSGAEASAQQRSVAELWIPAESIEMLPIRDAEKRETVRAAYRPAYRQIGRLYKRTQALTKKRDAQKKRKQNKAARQTQARLDKTQAQLKQKLQELHVKLKEAGLTDADLERARKMPRGPLRVERCTHALMLEAPDLTPTQKNLLQRLCIGVDASQAALRATRERLSKQLTGEENARQRQLLTRGLQRQHQLIENRLWRAVGYILSQDQMRALRAQMPIRYQQHRNLRGHLYMIPGLTPSQGVRINAWYTEVESESAADRAAVQRANKQLGDRSITQEQRAQLQRERALAQKRLQTKNIEFRDALRTTLNEEQLNHIRSVPPLLSPQDVQEGPGPLLRQNNLTEMQKQRLRHLQKQVDRQNREIRKRTQREIQSLNKEVGADSPQGAMMQMMQAGARAEVYAIRDEMAHHAVLEVLTPEQVVGWVVTPTGQR